MYSILDHINKGQWHFLWARDVLCWADWSVSVRMGIVWHQTNVGFWEGRPWPSYSSSLSFRLFIHKVEILPYHIFIRNNAYKMLNTLPCIKPSVHDYYKYSHYKYSRFYPLTFLLHILNLSTHTHNFTTGFIFQNCEGNKPYFRFKM